MITTLLACCLITLAACTRAADPRRGEGVNATVVPVRDAARPDDEPDAWVFRVILPGEKASEVDRPDMTSPLELVKFVGEQPLEVRHNGIWVLVNDENEISPVLKKVLKELVRLTGREDIPLFMCRSTEFPSGYDRVN